ncbi:MAG TPA: LacI family DNA-binding transcriptional regulator [Ignavibacteriales bacterium]|nr:LacI family DNA-binding transcriptional regulator [Ignavibacteriales bacterium]
MNAKVCANLSVRVEFLITINDIAEKVGVSVTTVSRVINQKTKKYRISSETEKLILKAADELGYRPNELARGLRLKRTHTLGMVVPDISNPFFSYVTHMIQKYASEAGYSLIVCNTNEDINTEMEQIELLRRKGVDGFIIMPVGIKHSHIKDLLIVNKPLVLLDRNVEEINANCVVIDNYKGSYEAVCFLIKNGHKRIAIIQGLPNTYTNNERLRGYKDALLDNGLPIDLSLIVGNDFRRENGYIETKMLLKMEDTPTAIFAFSDLITLGTLQALSEENIKVPDQMSLIAFDDIDFAPFLFSPLTCVRQPRELMGEAAVRLLIEELTAKGKVEKKTIELDPKLVIRDSVKHIN